MQSPCSPGCMTSCPAKWRPSPGMSLAPRCWTVLIHGLWTSTPPGVGTARSSSPSLKKWLRWGGEMMCVCACVCVCRGWGQWSILVACEWLAEQLCLWQKVKWPLTSGSWVIWGWGGGGPQSKVAAGAVRRVSCPLWVLFLLFRFKRTKDISWKNGKELLLVVCAYSDSKLHCALTADYCLVIVTLWEQKFAQAFRTVWL